MSAIRLWSDHEHNRINQAMAAYVLVHLAEAKRMPGAHPASPRPATCGICNADIGACEFGSSPPYFRSITHLEPTRQVELFE
jgi:hypothetical protein